jgi:hypothetical protein
VNGLTAASRSSRGRLAEVAVRWRERSCRSGPAGELPESPVHTESVAPSRSRSCCTAPTSTAARVICPLLIGRFKKPAPNQVPTTPGSARPGATPSDFRSALTCGNQT